MKNKIQLIFSIAAAVILFGCGLITSAIPILTTVHTQTPEPAPAPPPILQAALLPVNGDAASAALDRNLEAIYQEVSPSVVLITVFQKSGSGSSSAASGPSVVSGSGFVWDSQGNIVTNNHVVENAASIVVSFPDGGRYDAMIVGTDPGSDLAVIRIVANHSMLKPVVLGDSGAVKVGQIAIVIGYPFGLDSTMTSGIVSGLSRLLPVSTSDGSSLSYSIPDVIQTDAPINPGNSGGVLLNDLGEVIGVGVSDEIAPVIPQNG